MTSSECETNPASYIRRRTTQEKNKWSICEPKHVANNLVEFTPKSLRKCRNRVPGWPKINRTVAAIVSSLSLQETMQGLQETVLAGTAATTERAENPLCAERKERILLLRVRVGPRGAAREMTSDELNEALSLSSATSSKLMGDILLNKCVGAFQMADALSCFETVLCGTSNLCWR